MGKGRRPPEFFVDYMNEADNESILSPKVLESDIGSFNRSRFYTYVSDARTCLQGIQPIIVDEIFNEGRIYLGRNL